MRMFIGAGLPAGARERIGSQVLRQGVGGGVVPHENLHVTLAFLGEVEQGRVKAVREAMIKAVDGMEPFTVTTSRAGRFGRKGPGVLYLSVGDGAEKLKEVKARLDRALRDARIRFDDGREYTPHITLARRSEGGEGLSVPAESFELGGITLYGSERVNGRQAYTPVYPAGFPGGRLTVDRIEGRAAACENSAGWTVPVPLEDLPFQPREDMVIIKKDGAYEMIAEAGPKRRLSGRNIRRPGEG